MLPLPEDVDEENVRRDFRDGVLTLRLPRTRQAHQGRRIPIGETPGEAGQPRLTPKKAA